VPWPRPAKHAGTPARHLVHFEDTRKWIPLGDGRMPTLMASTRSRTSIPRPKATPPSPNSRLPTTFLLTSFYWENLIYFGMGPKKGADGKLAVHAPDGRQEAPGDGGRGHWQCAYGIFQRRAEFVGKTVGIAGEHLTGSEMAASLTRRWAGRPLQLRDARRIPELRLPRRGGPGQHVPVQARLRRDYCGARNLNVARALNPTLQTFDQWLAQNKGASRSSNLSVP